MKSKKWLISLGLAVVLVVSFALPACNGEPQEYWHTPIYYDEELEATVGGEKVTFDIGVTGFYEDTGLMVVEQLQDFGLDVGLQKLDPGTFLQYLYYPPGGGMEAMIYAEDPSPDPWSDWVWSIAGNPGEGGEGEGWNPSWYNNTAFDELIMANYVAMTFNEKKDILYEMQEVMATDVPMIWLIRESMINAARIDKWTGWYNMMGGFATWINEWSIREVVNITAETRLNLGISSMPKNMNYAMDELQYSNYGCLYLMFVYEPLVAYPKLSIEPEGAYTFIPRLCTNYSVDYEDGGDTQVWTYELRQGVKWHDYGPPHNSGKNFTADDLVYTLLNTVSLQAGNRPINWTAVPGGMSGTVLPEHVLVTKVNDYEVEMRYIKDYHQNEGYVPSFWLWYSMTPKHVFGPDGEGEYPEWNEDPELWDGEYIGTGPYTVTEFVADSYILHERVDDYWGPLPAAEELMFKLYVNPGPFWMAFDAGEMDSSASISVPFAKKAGYDADADVLVSVEPDMSVQYLAFNLHVGGGYPPLQDLTLRRAIAAAIDKQNIVDIAYGTYAEVQSSWVYPESPMYHSSLPNNTFDLSAATNLLLAANYTLHLP